MPSTVQRHRTYEKRRSGAIRQAIGFTTKPTRDAKSDGVNRVRLIDESGRETRVRVDQFGKSYRLAY